MEQTNNNYPRFEEGQVLTSKALNDYFGYLDEQQRLTRAQLLGVGIINGLEYEFSGSHLIIKKGTAVTADGYLIELPKDTTYTLAYTYDKNSDMLAKQNPLTGKGNNDFEKALDKIEYVLYEDENDATKHNQNPSLKKNIPSQSDSNSYIISLMVDFISQDTITQCSELSCDIMQSNYLIEIRPILINCTNINGNQSLYLKNLRPIYYNGILSLHYNLNLYKREIKPGSLNSYFEHTINSIISNSINYGITNMTNLSNDKVWDKLFPEQANSIKNHIAKLNNHITTFKNSISTLTTIPDYYVNHVITLSFAFEELFAFYNDLITKYKSYSCERFNRVIMLGSTDTTKNYRQLNDCSQTNKQQLLNDCELLLKHLNRLFALFQNLIEPNKLSNNRGIRLYKQKPHSKLGEQYEPYYYNYDAIKNDWNAHSFNNQRSSNEKSSDSVFIYDERDDWHDYLIIDNYYGLTKSQLDWKIVGTSGYSGIAANSYYGHHYPIDIEYIEDIDKDKFVSSYKNNLFNYNEVIKLFNQSSFLQNFCYDYEETLKKINNNADVMEAPAIRMLNAINRYLKICPDSISSFHLNYCKDYLLHCNYIHKRIVMIGGCPHDGTLLVFYKKDEKNNLIITAILGTYKGDYLVMDNYS